MPISRCKGNVVSKKPSSLQLLGLVFSPLTLGSPNIAKPLANCNVPALSKYRISVAPPARLRTCPEEVTGLPAEFRWTRPLGLSARISVGHAQDW